MVHERPSGSTSLRQQRSLALGRIADVRGPASKTDSDPEQSLSERPSIGPNAQPAKSRLNFETVAGDGKLRHEW
jgi:hypothetical protein